MKKLPQRIVIMGATSGIGLEMARRLAATGHTVGAAGRNTEALEGLQQKYPRNVFISRIDINEPQAVGKLNALADRMGGMDLYIHVSGIYATSTNLNPESETRVAQTNAVGFTRMVDAAFFYMRDKNDGLGQIAAVTSIAGTKGLGTLAAYSASKAYGQVYLKALEQLSRSKGYKLVFTDIRPGWIHTPLLPEGGRYTMMMESGYAVSRILRAIRCQRRVATIDWRFRLVVMLWKLIPDWLWVRLKVSL